MRTGAAAQPAPFRTPGKPSKKVVSPFWVENAAGGTYSRRMTAAAGGALAAASTAKSASPRTIRTVRVMVPPYVARRIAWFRCYAHARLTSENRDRPENEPLRLVFA